MANRDLMRIFHSFKIPKDLKVQVDHVEEQLARHPKNVFQSVINRVINTDFRTTPTIYFPELDETFNVQKPLENLKKIENELAAAPPGRHKQTYAGALASLQQLASEASVKNLTKNSTVKIEGVPNDDVIFDLSKHKFRKLDYEWLHKKGWSKEETDKLKAHREKIISEETLQAKLKKTSDHLLETAKIYDKAYEDLDTLFPAGGLKAWVESIPKGVESLRFYLYGDLRQILERHPEWGQEINQDILESKWAAFEFDDVANWEAKKKFDPHAHAHGHH